MHPWHQSAWTIDRSISVGGYPYVYVVAFMVGLALMILEAHRRQYALGPWLLITASAVFFMIFGTRVGAFSGDDWEAWWTSGTLSVSGRKTAVGALFFGFAGLWLVRRLLGFRQPLWDGFAYYLPLTLLFHRVGCLLAGCCTGLPTLLPWGVRYSGECHLVRSQREAGWIGPDELTSVAVHPVPAYEILTCLLIMGVLWMGGHRMKGPGQRIAFSVGAMLVARFLFEFVRDPVFNYSMAATWLGLKKVQWICLVLLAGLWVYVWTGRRAKTRLETASTLPGHRHWILYVMLMVMTLWARDFFIPVERIVLLVHLGAAGLAMVWAGYKSAVPAMRLPVWRVAFPGMWVLLFTGMSAETRPDSLPDARHNTHFTLQGGSMVLPSAMMPCIRTEEGCAGSFCAERDTLKPHGPRYSTIQAGVEHFIRLQNSYSAVFGLEAQWERYVNTDRGYKHRQGSYHIFGGMEGENLLGFRVGLRFGEMFRNTDFYTKTNVVPTVRCWIGHRPLAVVQFGMLDMAMPGGGPGMFNSAIVVNGGLLWKGVLGRFRVGAADLYGEQVSYFADLGIRLGPHFVLTPAIYHVPAARYAWGYSLGGRFSLRPLE